MLKNLAMREFYKTYLHSDFMKQAQGAVFKHAGEKGWGIIVNPVPERPEGMSDYEWSKVLDDYRPYTISKGYLERIQQEYDRLRDEWFESQGEAEDDDIIEEIKQDADVQEDG